MKKIVSILLLLFLVVSLAQTSSSFAATPPPTPSVSPLIQPGPNPGPPIGIPCGNTMCLEGEVCVQYPGDVDLHCVPEPLPENPNIPPECGSTGIFPPNSTCWNKFTNTQEDISLYEKTCIYEPVVEYSSTRYLHGSKDEQPFDMCGIGDCGKDCPVTPPGGDDYDCTVTMLVYTDVRDAELGSYGPNPAAEASYSADFLAQNYLYNSLFGRPLDLSDNYDSENNAKNDGFPTREAYRTYWRLLPASNQANLRSFVMNMANDDKILNIKFNYTDINGLKKQTDFKSLYNALSKQVIFFFHFPFIRIGCLIQYPVCPEYAQATEELKPVFQDLLEIAEQLNIPGATQLIQAYGIAAAAFGGDLDGPYAAFVPLDFSSARGYIVKKKDEVEEANYYYPLFEPYLRDTFNAGRYGTDKPPLTNISNESLPYVGAIYDGLLSPRFGMLPALQPSWVTEIYTEEDKISDYKLGNKPEDFPEIKIARRNFLESIKEETEAFLTNPLGWISSTVKGFFTDDDKKIGYTDIGKEVPNEDVRSAYDNPQGCPLPLSYHLLSPKTVPKTQDGDHHQVISIPGRQLSWSYNPERVSLEPKYVCPRNRITGLRECGWTTPVCPNDDEHYEEGGQCYTRRWEVSGIKHGKALTVLNNPKQTDIKKTIADNDKYSFFKMILPDGADKIPDASIDAPIAKHLASDGGAATGPNGSTEVFNPAEPINRVNNLAQDSMHILQNCWTVPDELQNSPRCDLDFPPEASASACTGEAFTKLAANPQKPSSKAESYFNTFINPKLTDDVITAYAEAEKQTGVPCEVLAGIHFEEGDNNPDQDLQSGAPLGGRTLTESAVQAATELKGKAGGDITSIDQLIRAMSDYNGGGNSNCQAGSSRNCSAAVTFRCGSTVSCNLSTNACTCPSGGPEPGSCRDQCGPDDFPYQFSYNFCPQPDGYDDPYVTNWWISPQHDNMYLLYMYDCTQTKPVIHARPGSLTVAIMLYLSGKK